MRTTSPSRGTTFHFVDAPPAKALEKARETAGGKDIRIGGGPTVLRDFLAAGLVDPAHIVDGGLAEWGIAPDADAPRTMM